MRTMSSSPRYEPVWTSISSRLILPGLARRWITPIGRKIARSRDDLLLRAARRLGGARDDDPILGAMEMPLQRSQWPGVTTMRLT